MESAAGVGAAGTDGVVTPGFGGGGNVGIGGMTEVRKTTDGEVAGGTTMVALGTGGGTTGVASAMMPAEGVAGVLFAGVELLALAAVGLSGVTARAAFGFERKRLTGLLRVQKPGFSLSA